MLDWLQSFLEDLSWQRVLIGVGAFVGMFLLSLVEVTIILVLLPANYFTKQYHRFHRDHQFAWRRLFWVVLKNLLGLLHVVAGILLSLPGIPGQGLLTILLGIMLMDLPGVRRMERWLVRRRKVRSSIDKIRAKFKKPPLVLDGDEGTKGSGAAASP